MFNNIFKFYKLIHSKFKFHSILFFIFKRTNLFYTIKPFLFNQTYFLFNQKYFLSKIFYFYTIKLFYFYLKQKVNPIYSLFDLLFYPCIRLKDIDIKNTKLYNKIMQTEKLYYTKYFCPETLQILIAAEFCAIKLQLNEINKKYDSVNLVTK